MSASRSDDLLVIRISAAIGIGVSVRIGRQIVLSVNRGMKEPVLVRWIGGGGGASAPAPPPPAPEVLVIWICGAVALLGVCSIARGFNRSAGKRADQANHF